MELYFFMEVSFAILLYYLLLIRYLIIHNTATPFQCRPNLPICNSRLLAYVDKIWKRN